MSEPRWNEILGVDIGQLLAGAHKLLQEGHLRRIVIRRGDRALVELPLAVGVVGFLVAPGLTGLGTLAALLGECTIAVERVVPEAPAAAQTPAEGTGSS
ncbi:MAG: DUF4342 domain-containing protein [Myxococcales bacterium]|nr:DUF4342 domain-containing protein [Myxococcota bacterium]MDW8282714.1 DUF4342 domain-containing protein [Myxococcales bacterium]